MSAYPPSRALAVPPASLLARPCPCWQLRPAIAHPALPAAPGLPLMQAWLGRLACLAQAAYCALGCLLRSCCRSCCSTPSWRPAGSSWPRVTVALSAAAAAAAVLLQALVLSAVSLRCVAAAVGCRALALLLLLGVAAAVY